MDWLHLYDTPPIPPQHKEVIAENTVLRLGMAPTVTHAYQPGRSPNIRNTAPSRATASPGNLPMPAGGPFCHLNFL